MAGMRVSLAQLTCNSTTEWGADEIYFLIAGKHSNGTEKRLRLPGDNKHWDMNDGDQPDDNDANGGDSHAIKNRDLFSIDLAVGEMWSGILAIMEEDGGTTEQGQAAIATILLASAAVATATGYGIAAAPFLLVAGDLMYALTSAGIYAKDTDDYIGSIKIQIINTGVPQIKFEPLGRVTNSKYWDNGLAEYWMNGDGSEYDVIMNWETY